MLTQKFKIISRHHVFNVVIKPIDMLVINHDSFSVIVTGKDEDDIVLNGCVLRCKLTGLCDMTFSSPMTISWEFDGFEQPSMLLRGCVRTAFNSLVGHLDEEIIRANTAA